MSYLIITENINSELSIFTFRLESDFVNFKINCSDEILLILDKISRNSLQQIERHFRRMLTKEYILKLSNDDSEVEKIYKIYEIGARR